MINFNNSYCMFILFYIITLECLCSSSIAGHDLNESNMTSLHLNESNITDFTGNISGVHNESMKSKVRKRPGVLLIPEPKIISDSESVNDSVNINCVNLKLKNSTVSPRKGACNPPPVNDLSKLNSSFTIADKFEFNDSNHSIINSEVLSKDNRTDAFQSQNVSNINAESAKEPNLHIGDNETYFVITTTVDPSAAATVPEKLNSTTVSSANVTPTNILENKLDANFSLTTFENEFLNLTSSSKKPFTTSAEDANDKKSNTWAVVGAIFFVVILCALVGYVAYKRLYAYWDRRHYSRMDFLIDGLYEM